MFRMRKDSERWFRKIADQPPIKTKLDLFYLCLMAGLKFGQLDEVRDASDVYHRFTQEFEGSRQEIIALLIVAELRREGLDFDDKSAVQTLISKYVTSDTPANLTSAGFDKINSYASGGFNILSEHFEDGPHDVNVFLTRYSRMIGRDAPATN